MINYFQRALPRRVLGFQYFYRDYQNIVSETCKPCSALYISGVDNTIVQRIAEHFEIYNNFISENEETELVKEIDIILKRRRYEKDHWDNAIIGYKETEKPVWNEVNTKIIQKVRALAFTSNCSQIKSVHVLDLSKEGYIKPHVDSVRFCGDTIAGLSLLSSSVMRLANKDNRNLFVDILLPQRSLYIMKGIARYDFTHEILDSTSSYFKGEKIIRNRRISVICRNEPPNNS